MAADNCCDPVTPVSCIKRCPRLVDACCVVDEQVLDCILEPITVTASGFNNQFVITVADVTGIAVGMSVTGPAIGTGAVVESISGLVITLSVANTADFPGVSVGDEVVFHFIDNRQCDINKGINDRLCELETGAVPCHEWTTAVLADPIMDLVWTAGSPVQYSDPLSCQVRLKGTLQATFDPVATQAINSQLFQIPAGPSRPLIQKVLSVTVVLNSDTQFLALYVPGLISVSAAGLVQVVFTNFNPLVARPSSCPDCPDGDLAAKVERYFADATEITAFVSLDGLTYDTQ